MNKFSRQRRGPGKQETDVFYNEANCREAKNNDNIDSKYGFVRVSDCVERTGYLFNMHTNEILDEDKRLTAALDLFFIQMDGSRFKASVVFQPYFLIKIEQEYCLEVVNFLKKKYLGMITAIQHMIKDDLDLANHLSGIKQEYIKLSFLNSNALNKVKREIQYAVRKNQEKKKLNTDYIRMLRASLNEKNEDDRNDLKNVDFMDYIIDIREHDVPYHIRVSIDLKIFCGQWYNIRCSGSTDVLPTIVPREDILDRPEPVILAYDIETTKLPLKFPDSQTDQIMMISYMIDGQGYLITNREIISSDVNDFEYTPKPEFEGNFIVYNELNEKDMLEKFFDHIIDIKPHIFVTYNGDFFDWPFVEARAALYNIDMKQEIGFSKSRDGLYLCRTSIHMDCLCWVKRDSYLPVGSQGLKAVAKAKLRYDPVELDPEEMCKMAVQKPQILATYSVSDAVATYYLYMKYVHPFIFALATIIPMEPDEILRKGSGTLCETLLMVEAFHANIIFPNKQQEEHHKISFEGHVLDSETYVGGHVEALECGVFRADVPCRFRLDQIMIDKLKSEVDQVLAYAIEVEEKCPLSEVKNFGEIKQEITQSLQALYDIPNRLEQPVIYHLDVGAMYPNIILTNRLQPSAMVDEADCATCCFNTTGALCKRPMDWLWRGEMLPATKNELQRIQQQLKTEKFPPIFPGAPERAFYQLSKLDQVAYEKKRLMDYCRKAYKKTKITKLETRTSTVCQKENSFYVDTVRAFRDRRYEYKKLTKSAKSAISAAIKSGDATEIKAAKGREVLYDSLQLAHKCILNSFYGYVMRKGARWYSMSMAGIVCLTGSNIITKAKDIIERIGRPLELDTDGIWCILPGSFPQEFTIYTNNEKKDKFNISYPNAVLNSMVKDFFTNDQYYELLEESKDGKLPIYEKRSENSILFEVDGPYFAMVLPAAKEEGKKLKKRYAVFNFDGSLAELKGFEVKRRGELQLIKNFQSSVFEAFLLGSTLEECYASVAKVADYWLDVLYTRGSNLPDTELFELISENRSMSRKLEDYGNQKSTSISTAKRLAEFLGDQMVKDVGLACKYIISKKPEGSPVTERAIPLAIFQSEPSIRRHYLGSWLKDSTIGDADIRDILDWSYYIERLSGTIQKIITIPAALQGLNNPVPRVQHPDWLYKKILEKNDILKQRRITELFASKPNINIEKTTVEVIDIENVASTSHNPPTSIPVVTKRKRTQSINLDTETKRYSVRDWKNVLGIPPPIGITRNDIIEWVIFQKKKWEWQLEQREKNKHTTKKFRAQSHRSTATLGGFLRQAKRSLIEGTWQIIQITPVDDNGGTFAWVLIDDELHKIKLTVPRIFYVNRRKPASCENNQFWKKVNKILPRSHPNYNLYKYSIPENVFKNDQLGISNSGPDIDGIYEVQISLEYRVLIELGCICTVQRDEVQRLKKSNIKDDTFSIEQLEYKSLSYHPYLPNFEKSLKKIFLYQHNSQITKKEMWALFLPAIKKGIIFVLDTVRTNQMPNIKNLYITERLALMNNLDNEKLELLPAEDITFEIFLEVDVKQIYNHIQKALTNYKTNHKGPTVLCLQTAIDTFKLLEAIRTITDFPYTKINIVDDAGILSNLDWQRTCSRSIIRHYLNLNTVVNVMLEQCRYYNLPLGNMPTDTVIFGADLFFARLLQKHNFVLWWSTTSIPDLGGRELDDSHLLAEFDDNTSFIQNKPGFYENICIELTIENLAISAVLQHLKIQELEGADAAVGFDITPQASLKDMIENINKSVIMSSYSDTALCYPAFRIMRTMISNWLREVSLNRNIFSDFQISHFYRWIQSCNSYLYEPGLRKSVNNFMRKLFLQIIVEFQTLGIKIIYADFNKIVIDSGKTTSKEALSYVDYVVQVFRNKEIFHSINISFKKCWNFMLWLNPANYSAIQKKIPIELTSQATPSSSTSETDEEITIEMNWNYVEYLPKENDCQEKFETLLTSYLKNLIEHDSPSKAVQEISHQAFDFTQKLHKNYLMGKESPALYFTTTLHKILSVDKRITTETNDLRRNMLRLIGIGEFSDLATWKNPVQSCIIREVMCKACNHCRNLDLYEDKYRAVKNGERVWLCSQCYVCFENEEIERRLLDIVQRKMMSYVLQDVRCIRCKQIKRENLTEFCSCGGTYETVMLAENIKSSLNTFSELAETHNMIFLKELTKNLLMKK